MPQTEQSSTPNDTQGVTPGRHRVTVPGTAAAPAVGGAAAVALHVYVPDVDAVTDQAVTAGAELLAPPAAMSYGYRQSTLRDPFGHVWIFLTPLSPPTALTA
ncbi:VOC family protein [Kitasatospora sp. NPDC001660]